MCRPMASCRRLNLCEALAGLCVQFPTESFLSCRVKAFARGDEERLSVTGNLLKVRSGR